MKSSPPAPAPNAWPLARVREIGKAVAGAAGARRHTGTVADAFALVPKGPRRSSRALRRAGPDSSALPGLSSDHRRRSSGARVGPGGQPVACAADRRITRRGPPRRRQGTHVLCGSRPGRWASRSTDRVRSRWLDALQGQSSRTRMAIDSASLRAFSRSGPILVLAPRPARESAFTPRLDSSCGQRGAGSRIRDSGSVAPRRRRSAARLGSQARPPRAACASEHTFPTASHVPPFPLPSRGSAAAADQDRRR